MYTLQCKLCTTPEQEASEVPISGLVVIFHGDGHDHDSTLAVLRSASGIEVGVCENRKCAIVVDSPTREDDKKIQQWVRELPGVADVQIAFVGFDDDERSDSASTTTDSAD